MRAVAIITATMIFLLSPGCTRGSGGKVVPVTAQETQGLLRNGFAVLVDLTQVPAEKLEEFLRDVPKDRQVVVYTPDESEGAAAAQKAASLGYRASHLKSLK